MELIIKPATDEETIEALKNTIERLQQQIKKMKCCENCKYQDSEEYTGCPVCSLGVDCSKKINDEFVLTKWELAE